MTDPMRLGVVSAQQLCKAAAVYCQSLQALPRSQCYLSCSSLQHTDRLFQTFAAASEQFVTLNTLKDNPGATHSPKRVGRGIGSGLGKTAGRGHKGQKARTGRDPKEGFEGGQTPLRLRVGKRGFRNPFQKELVKVNLDKLAERLEQGRLQPGSVVTMQTLREAGVIGKKIASGVKLLGGGADKLKQPLHLQVTEASTSAREAIQQLGGSVTTVYYNQLGLRALLRPDWFAAKGRLLPRPAQPPPKLCIRYDQIGELPPNMALPSS